MSKKWTDQQKLLHDIKVAGGAVAVGTIIASIGIWGADRAKKLCDEVNEDDMGIDRANSILGMANDLGPEIAEDLLADALANKHKNVTPLFRKRA